jgi:hypothetical protein
MPTQPDPYEVPVDADATAAGPQGEAPDPRPLPPSTDRPPRRRGRRLLWVMLGVLALPALALGGLTLYWCQQPQGFDVAEVAAMETEAVGGRPVPGATVVATTIRIAETLLQKPGGLTHNDRLPPGVLMDNCPSWECGVVMALRDVVQAMRNDFTRAQTQSVENLDLREADLRFAIDPKSWIMPTAEVEYREGIDALRAYLADLGTGQLRGGLFHPRADNLADYLALVEKRLGNFGLRLAASVGDPQLISALGVTEPGESALKVDGDEVDHVFYCARGYSWAFAHIMQAIAIDFDPALEDKNARETMAQIGRDLQGAIKPMYSPVVFNGRGYGLLANHSLVIGSYIARVNAAVIDLRLLLQQG